MNEMNVPLVVDLDGTLINTDLLVESFMGLLKLNILYIFIVPFWLVRGKAYLKSEIAKRVDLDVNVLPYNSDLLEFIKGERSSGRKVILATASNKKYAYAVSEHLGLFHETYSSCELNNLEGPRKSQLLEKEIGMYKFDYVGNSKADCAVWENCRNAILVNCSEKLKKNAQNKFSVSAVFDKKGVTVRAWFKALRLHQWVKNVLVFVPLFLSHEYANLDLIENSLLAFLFFGLCASSVYIINDLLDLTDDRYHRTKRNRPFADGTIPILWGAAVAVIILTSSFIGSFFFLPLDFTYVLVSYYILTLSYSMYLKQKVLLDVQVLAGLYTIRIIAGAAAISVELSFWLLIFSVFFFLSLAIVKRYTELLVLRHNSLNVTRGRDYRVEDIELLSSLGGSAGYISVLILALFINSDVVTAGYSTPELLWVLCPVMLYWISRVWIIAHRGDMKDDPIVFAVKDRVSIVIAFFISLIFIFAK